MSKEKDETKEQAPEQEDEQSDLDTVETEPKPAKSERIPPTDQLPKPNFSQYIYALAMQSLIFSGKQINPQTQKYETNIEIARYHIDLLEMLQEKTKGNLDKNEEKLIGELLHNCRMAFLDAQKGG